MSKAIRQSGDETRPIIKEIKYSGLKHATVDEIDTLAGLRLGGLVDPKQNQKACLLIAEHLNKMGRPFATVDLVKGGKEGDDTVEFSISEGPKVQIREVEFTGNSFISAGVLRTHLSAKPRTQTTIAADIEQLVEYYRSFGFRDVLITHELKRTGAPGEATVVFHIEEGKRYERNPSSESGQSSSEEVTPDAHDEIEFPFLGIDVLRKAREMRLMFADPDNLRTQFISGNKVITVRRIRDKPIFQPARNPLAVGSDWECPEILDEVRVLRDQSRLFGGPGFQEFYMVLPGFYR